MKKLALYIHIPFCHHKCGYCDFLSFSGMSPKLQKTYVEKVKEEIAFYGDRETYWVTSIFFGGGTPSVLPYEALAAIFHTIQENFVLAEDCEVTLEANPESYLTLEMPSNHPFNRLSLGVQSASPHLLQVAERIHSVDMARAAFLKGREDGFSNINLDFIASIPGESRGDVERTLALISELAPEHVSLYSLILEEGTAFSKNREKYPWVTEEEDREHVHRYQRGLENRGYAQYEISNFAKEGRACLHNRAYWEGQDYRGFGLGAHSFVGRRRYWNEDSFSAYFEVLARGEAPVSGFEDLSPLDRTNEIIVLALRMKEGIALDYKLPTGEEFGRAYGAEIDLTLGEGLGEVVDGHFRLTERGMDLANLVEERFFRL